METDVESLRLEIKRKEEELLHLKALLDEKEQISEVHPPGDGSGDKTCEKTDPQKLTNAQIARYSRQLILPELGVQGQLCLLSSKILIVGAGGLGCPAAIYLAAAGVGTIGVVDYDEVEISNLHRQILHTESRVGVHKAQSIAMSCRNLNSDVKVVPYKIQLNSENALPIIKQYDIVLDATDNVATRYLLNDVCVLAGKPLVSGSALRFEGQLTVYNHKGGPCYRCLYPKPPPPETVTNCSDGGVLGVVPGIIGCYQALEAIKIAAKTGSTLNQRLMLFDALDCSSRVIKLRPRQVHCPVCGDSPSITHLIDYEQFCGARATDKDQEKTVLPVNSRVTAKEYQTMVSIGQQHVLLDVRLPVEMDICQLPHPAITLRRDPAAQLEKIKSSTDFSSSVVVVCRRGNDSQLAVKLLQSADPRLDIKDIRGGLHAWARDVDPHFPVY
ncbi:hypothetical protein BaRGS_00023794 [Batillaria attramentaria]|uniref:Adenylyltransferase and sulfurtransferase MOCS3 homolog n=1 Tax=Batillaria attramentaria TaxID=370345 RepID=A0ABD0KDE9_9CAEN